MSSYNHQHGSGLPLDFQTSAFYAFHDSGPVVYAHQPNDFDTSSSHYVRPGGGGYAEYGSEENYAILQPPRPDSPYMPPGGSSAYPRRHLNVPLAPEHHYASHELQHVNYPQFMSQSYPSIPLHDYSQLHPSRSASYPPTHTLDNTVTPGQLNLAGGYASGSATAEDEMDTDYDPLDGLIQQLKRELNLPPSMLLSLESIVDPGPGQKPSPQYMVLVQVAILSSPRQRLTLQEIYRALQDRFHYFRERNQPKEPWKESIRHMLTLKKAFKLERRELNEPGKGSYWTLSFEEGDTRIRHRKDKTNRARFLGRPLHDNLGDNADSDTEGPSTPSGSNRPTRSRHTQHSLSSLSVDVRSRSPAASDSGSSYINSPVSAPASISGSIGPYRNTGSSRRRPDNH